MSIKTHLRKTHSEKPYPVAGISAFVLAALALAQPASAGDNPGAHEHGSARLQMALEANRIDLMLKSPAYNLAGFEHEARTDEQRGRLADIRSWLETTPVINNEAGDCKVTAVTVELGGTSEDHGEDYHKDHHDHDHGHDDDHGHDHEHGHGHGHGHDDKATHRDYEVSQQLQCGDEGSGGAFSSPLMSRFPDLQELTIEWVGPSGQGSVRMTSAGQTFSPGG